jgi:cytidyltransferase-like protein
MPVTVKKVFVSGCFDMLHSGHIEFLERAASYGEVYVAIGSDQTIRELKGREPVNSQDERQYMIQALKHVKHCLISRGSGVLDFAAELNQVAPDILIVNEDGSTPAKAQLCRRLGIRYIVLKRTPHGNLPQRSTTSLRKECRIPYRLDLAGGWLDQPFVSRYGSGPVLTICVEPTMEFSERSGMASSTRRRAIELWQMDVPEGNRERLARVLFSYENPPGTKEWTGSQDAIGIVYPGLNRLDYSGKFWPDRITPAENEATLRWLEKHLYLVALGPRKSGFRALRGQRVTPAKVRALAAAADYCWKSLLTRNAEKFGRWFRASFEAQVALFPAMSSNEVRFLIRQFAGQALGWKLAGAGGGGYLILFSRKPIPGAMQVKIRRSLRGEQIRNLL